ncbi:MAG: WYL domain-containing protein [Desulfovibrionaceae bacterium]|nr:WYL domain-containing protein [Desulfovibrionaceae bacterium]
MPASDAKYILERKFFQRQDIREQPDGSLLIHVETSGRWDLIHWVLSRGAEVELPEPEDLREELKPEIDVLAERYSSQAAASILQMYGLSLPPGHPKRPEPGDIRPDGRKPG